jgi:hypothetical protein
MRMKKIPETITSLEKSLAFMEGIHAFDEGLSRSSNPYIGRNEELMRAWWCGWDQAHEEDTASHGS